MLFRTPHVMIAVVMLTLAMGAGCGNGGDREAGERAASTREHAKLLEAADPLMKAHDLLKDLSYKVDGGLTRGDFIKNWPDVYAQVQRLINDDYGKIAKDKLNKSETAAYIRNSSTTSSEKQASDAVAAAQTATKALDGLKTLALTPRVALAPEHERYLANPSLVRS